MKKIILAATLLAVAATQVQPAKAGGWPIAAGVVGGLAAGTVIGASIARQPVYYAPAPAYYYPPTTYYQTAPAVVSTPAPAPTAYQATDTQAYQAPAPTQAYSYAPAPTTVVYAQPAPTVVYAAAPAYYPAPIVSFGFGFARPYYWGGGYRGYRGHYYGHGRW